MARPEDIEQPETGVDSQPEVERPSEAPQYREVTINGRKFQTAPELADAFSELTKSFDRKLNEHSTELGNLRKFYNEHKPVTPTVEKGYDQLLFEDPNGAVNRLKNEIRQEYIQEKRMEQFWKNFYKTHKDLDEDDEFIVKAVLNEHAGDLARLPVEEASEKLAEMSRKQILRYQQRAQEDNDDTAPRTRVESPSRPIPRAVPKEDEGPASLTDLLKRRANARSGKAA